MYEELDDLKYIKKHYGEKMSHLCRELFPSILERPGLLYNLFTTHFYPSKSLYYDIINENKENLFKEYIYCFTNENKDKKKVDVSVRELLDSVGYDIYECKTNEDIQKFRKYYKDNEALCTFRDPHRIDGHYIFFIVKKEVNDIKREDFKEPRREDEYSTSVLDLQFDKGNHQRVSIKSRYNHKVNNPDATYSNNLEKIVEGLTSAFEREYGFNIGNEYKTNFELDHYILARDRKFYKYNYEMHNTHYCPDNIIIRNGYVLNGYKDKSRYIVFDYFILDIKKKKLSFFDFTLRDGLKPLLHNINRIEINKNSNNKEIKIICEDTGETIITLDENNKMIKFENNTIEEIGENFLVDNLYLHEIKLPNLKVCDNRFMNNNIAMKNLYLPSLEECESMFLVTNKLESIDLPSLTKCGAFFLSGSERLHSVNLPKLEKCGAGFISTNDLESINLPNLRKCENSFMERNKKITKVSLPKLELCGTGFLTDNVSLEKLELPSLRICCGSFIYSNKSIKELYLPNLEVCGTDFLTFNVSLEKLELPNLKKCGSSFLLTNKIINYLYLPKLISCDAQFLYCNKGLRELNLPSLELCLFGFIAHNESLERVNLPKLKRCNDNFLYENSSLEELSLPSLEKCGDGFMENNTVLKNLYVPNLRYNSSSTKKSYVSKLLSLNKSVMETLKEY